MRIGGHATARRPRDPNETANRKLKNKPSDQVIALAGILQATSLVDQAARTGLSDLEPMATCLRSLIIFDAPTTASVFGGVASLEPGLRLLRKLLETPTAMVSQPAGIYGLAVLKLERRLAHSPSTLESLGHQLRAFAANMEEPITEEPNVASLARIYSDNLSALPPRILVNGDPRLLQRRDIGERVRSLLLAAVRSAVMWRQKGGKPFKLLLNRRLLHDTSDQLLREAVDLNLRNQGNRELS